MSVYMGNCNVFDFHFEFINSYHIFLSVMKIILYNILAKWFFFFFFVKHIQQVLAYKNILGFVRTLLIKSMQNLQSMKYPLWINN